MAFILRIFIFGLVWTFSPYGVAQTSHSTDARPPKSHKPLIVTGARFTYKLMEKWINEYTRINPDVQITIESRGSSDPVQHDILIEVYDHPQEVKDKREYLYIARYAILPVANGESAFAREFAGRGLDRDAFREIFFHDIFSDKRKQKPIEMPFTVYTRMQKAGVPFVFARHFGFEQKDIRGTRIAGADAHLLKALLRDSIGVSYLPLPLIYDEVSRTVRDGLTVLPPDLNGNRKVSFEEKFYNSLDTVIERLEALDAKEINNVPLEYLHLSVDREKATPEAFHFIQWILENGLSYLHDYGYLNPGSHAATAMRSRGLQPIHH